MLIEQYQDAKYCWVLYTHLHAESHHCLIPLILHVRLKTGNLPKVIQLIIDRTRVPTLH